MLHWHVGFALHSLRMKKGRTAFVLIAISLSVGVIVASNGAVDNLSTNFVKTQFTTLPSIDVVIKHTDNSLINNISPIDNSLSNSHLKGVSPRIKSDGAIFYSNPDNQTISSPVTVFGLNITQENYLGIGSFSPAFSSLPVNQCLLIGSLGQQVSSASNSSMTLRLYLSATESVNISISKSFTVNANKKFSASDKNILVVNIATLYQFLPQNSATEVVGIFTDHNSLYTVSNVGATVNKIKNRVIGVQEKLGYNYIVQVPIAQALVNVQSNLAGSNMLLTLISTLLIILSIFMIYSLISTSVEERVHEYGIFRAIGISSKEIFYQTILQAMILAVIGAVSGLILGVILLVLILPTFSLQGTSLASYLNFATSALIVGIGTTLIASILPARQSTKKQILSALDVTRIESSEYQTRIASYRTKFISWKYVFWGIFMSFIGIFMFVVFPGIQYYYGQDTVNSLAMFIIIVQFLGCILICIGFFGPLLEKILIAFFSLFSKEKSFVVKLFLRKNRRRNLSTTMIYAIAFSFIFFLSINTTLMFTTSIYELKKDTGSDYQIYSNDQQAHYLLNGEVLNYIKQYPNVDSSYVTIPSLTSITGCSVTVGDQIYFKSIQPTVYGTEGSLLSSLFHNYELTPGSNFTKINDNNTVVISASLAKWLNLQVGDLLRVKISSPVQSINERYGKDYSLTIVGIALHIAGFPDVSTQDSPVGNSAVFIGPTTWSTFVSDNLNQNVSTGPDIHNFIDKIFVKKTANYNSNIKKDLFLQFGSKIGIVDYQSQLSELEDNIAVSSNITTAILSLITALTLFAVISSTSTTIMESQKDIGLLKTLGLNNGDVTKIFILEAFIVGLAASFIGSATGYIVEYMIEFNNSLYGGWPLFFVLPPITIIITYLMALFFAYIGSRIPAKRISKLNISEIFRSSQ